MVPKARTRPGRWRRRRPTRWRRSRPSWSPGARISALQAAGRAVYRKHGFALAEDALIFFHGLGLSHLDQEVDAEGAVTGDFAVEAGMAIATHIYYPGDRRERMWLEDIALIGDSGPAGSIFGWDFLPHGLDG